MNYWPILALGFGIPLIVFWDNENLFGNIGIAWMFSTIALALFEIVGILKPLHKSGLIFSVGLAALTFIDGLTPVSFGLENPGAILIIGGAILGVNSLFRNKKKTKTAV